MNQNELDELLHDLKNPLTNIKLTTDLLLEGKLGELTESVVISFPFISLRLH